MVVLEDSNSQKNPTDSQNSNKTKDRDLTFTKSTKTGGSDLSLNLKFKPLSRVSKEMAVMHSSPRKKTLLENSNGSNSSSELPVQSNRSCQICIPLPNIEENPTAPSDDCRSAKAAEVGRQSSPTELSRAADADTPSTVEASAEAPVSPGAFKLAFQDKLTFRNSADADQSSEEDESSFTETPRSLTYDQLRAYHRPFNRELGARPSATPSARPSTVPTLRVRRALPPNARPDLGAALRDELAHCHDSFVASVGDAEAALGRLAGLVPPNIANNPLLRRWHPPLCRPRPVPVQRPPLPAREAMPWPTPPRHGRSRLATGRHAPPTAAGRLLGSSGPFPVSRPSPRRAPQSSGGRFP